MRTAYKNVRSVMVAARKVKDCFLYLHFVCFAILFSENESMPNDIFPVTSKLQSCLSYKHMQEVEEEGRMVGE